MSGLWDGLMGAVIGAAISLIAAWLGIMGTARQIRAQTYLPVLERAERLELSRVMDSIRRREDSPGIYDDHSPELNQEAPTAHEAALYAELREPQKTEIRRIVDFFNDLAHLMRNNYIDRRMIIRLYYSSMRSCAEKLWPWWIKGVRVEQESTYLYETFDLLCRYVLAEDYAARRRFPMDIPRSEVAKRINSTTN